MSGWENELKCPICHQLFGNTRNCKHLVADGFDLEYSWEDNRIQTIIDKINYLIGQFDKKYGIEDSYKLLENAFPLGFSDSILNWSNINEFISKHKLVKKKTYINEDSRVSGCYDTLYLKESEKEALLKELEDYKLKFENLIGLVD